MSVVCEYCSVDVDDKGNDICAFPYYGRAPHNSFYQMRKHVGENTVQVNNEIPLNFEPDLESITDDGVITGGIYTYCLNCGDGMEQVKKMLKYNSCC